mgnify:CR=1 FL=1
MPKTAFQKYSIALEESPLEVTLSWAVYFLDCRLKIICYTLSENKRDLPQGMAEWPKSMEGLEFLEAMTEDDLAGHRGGYAGVVEQLENHSMPPGDSEQPAADKPSI